MQCSGPHDPLSFFFSLSHIPFPGPSRHVQQSWYAEPDAADLREPSADAEHALCSIHAQYDAVFGTEPRRCLAGLSKVLFCWVGGKICHTNSGVDGLRVLYGNLVYNDSIFSRF